MKVCVRDASLSEQSKKKKSAKIVFADLQLCRPERSIREGPACKASLPFSGDALEAASIRMHWSLVIGMHVHSGETAAP